jgi:hypothetical protein
MKIESPHIILVLLLPGSMIAETRGKREPPPWLLGSVRRYNHDMAKQSLKQQQLHS